MKEKVGVNLFSFTNICITTNGSVKKDGTAVMGRGVAQVARDQFVGLDARLGYELKKKGNRVFSMGWQGKYFMLTFPTKHNWNEVSDIELIKESCTQLMEAMDILGLEEVYLPRPGCGDGGLDWEDVKPEIEPLLDDRVTVVTLFE